MVISNNNNNNKFICSK